MSLRCGRVRVSCVSAPVAALQLLLLLSCAAAQVPVLTPADGQSNDDGESGSSSLSRDPTKNNNGECLNGCNGRGDCLQGDYLANLATALASVLFLPLSLFVVVKQMFRSLIS